MPKLTCGKCPLGLLVEPIPFHGALGGVRLCHHDGLRRSVDTECPHPVEYLRWSRNVYDKAIAMREAEERAV